MNLSSHKPPINLSVIIPTFNSEGKIGKCLDSLVSQTDQNFEICIIDACSSDETLSTVNRFRSDANQIRIISEPDKGIYDAMNKGIDLARGDWLYFIGSDDEVADQDVFSDVFREQIPEQSSVLYGNVLIKGDTPWAKSDQIYDGYFDLKKLFSKNICHQAIFYRRSLFHKFGKYRINYPVCADWEVNLRFFPKTKYIYVDRVIANFYSGGLSSKETNDPFFSELESFKKKILREYRLRRFFIE